ncbi:MAG: hypothetical protein KGI08_05225 [Thaumarchaeota archaeon]|nr:hypothetical protein [Nitrososphaerota archaeon]
MKENERERRERLDKEKKQNDMVKECKKQFAKQFPKKIGKSGAGMPGTLWLNEFGSQVEFVFGTCPYQVGSSLFTTKWRDVDVRVILSDEEWEKWGFKAPSKNHYDGKWVALCMAFSELGKRMTGLPIDFQIQQQTDANSKFKGRRSALGLVDLRMVDNKLI